MSGYFRRVLDALAGRAAAPPPADEPRRVLDEVDLRARLSALEMDLHERDRQVETMRQEYAALKAAGEHAAAGAGQDQLERLFKKLAGPMSNLSALAELSESGKDVPDGDLVSLFHAVEKELARAGLERVGRCGEDAPFDTAVHQRMSGGAVHAGTPVTVRVPGYRMGGRILIKAMVSAGDGHG